MLTNSCGLPCIVFSYPYSLSNLFPTCGLPVLFPGNSQIKTGCEELGTPIQKIQRQEKVSSVAKLRNGSIRKPSKKQPRPRKEDKDAEFKQRHQTANRNLYSNTLKIFLKQLRDKNSETFLNICKIIATYRLKIGVDHFIARIDHLLPATCTYISLDSVRRVCRLPDQGDDGPVARIFRICLMRFFRYEIYSVNIKSIRTTRKIRSQQIKQGKIFLRQLF